MPTIPDILAIDVQSVHKSFSGVRVLEGISFNIRPGEVHTLMGENGAGKSTLMKILAGVHRPDAGTLHLFDQPITLASPHAALAKGIALIHQEPLSFPDLSVAENIFIGRGTPRNAVGLIDWPTMNRRAAEALKSLGVSLNPKAKVRGLSVADQQMVELAAALSQNARVLLMDEPTAALTPREVDDLFAIVRRLKASGVAIVFISHRLPEVFAISDRITVLRDGACIGTRAVADTTTDEIIRMMVGRELGKLYEKSAAPRGPVRLCAKNLSKAGLFENISLEIHAGEIVGLAGLVGAGRTDVARALFGIAPADSGTILIDNHPASIRSPQDATKNKIACVPEDRALHGIFPPMSIAANTAMASLPKVSRLGWLSAGLQRALAADWKSKLAIRLRDTDQPIRELSGGNQQKVILARWLATAPDILILDEPTRGVDVGAKAESHHLMAELARQGKAILMISSDLPEVLAMSDRILVMREGRLAGEFTRENATQESIMSAATGQSTAAAPTSARRKSSSTLAARLMQFRELSIAAVVLLVTIGVALIYEHRKQPSAPAFLSPGNLESIIQYIPAIIAIALGQMLIIITRNIDLSVGSVQGFSAILVGNLFLSPALAGHGKYLWLDGQYPDMPIPVAFAIAAAVGAAMGLLNGVLVALFRVPAIIATLGAMTAYRGLIFIYSGGRQVDALPPRVHELSQSSPIPGIPWLFILTAALALLAALWLRFTTTGRNIFALGSNPHAALLRGIPVKRTLLLVFTLTGALAGFSGLYFGAQNNIVNPGSAGLGMELIVISAVVIGGTNVFGGSGSVFGTVLGALLLGVIAVALPSIDISQGWQNAVYGMIILVAVLMDALLQRKARSTEAA